MMRWNEILKHWPVDSVTRYVDIHFIGIKIKNFLMKYANGIKLENIANIRPEYYTAGKK